MNTVLITTAVCGGYALFGFIVIRTHDRPVPHWWRRMVSALRRFVRALAAIAQRTARTARSRARRLVAAARLHPMGVSHR